MIKISFFLLALVSQVNAATDRNYAGVKQFLADLQKNYPKTVQTFTLGKSDSGEDIVGVKIGSGEIPNLVVGTHHGNEYGSTEVALAFAESVADKPLNHQTMYVIPVLNIPGYNSRSRHEMANGRYHDANRDYPSPCGTDGPFNLKSTLALADFVREKGIVGSATLHTYTGAALYPWGISTHDVKTEYDELFIELTKTATAHSGYQFGNSTDLLYPADGTFEDYAFMEHGVWSILFELGYSHSPSQADIDKMIERNVPGLRDMFTSMPSERAEKHAFTGKCEARMLGLDRRDE
ncbi:MAG: hypothetical protein KA715_11115 [Xanthomonadaceae bacterium]|nr:hypothetical protein [Xanthomonadaceae bacterium]